MLCLLGAVGLTTLSACGQTKPAAPARDIVSLVPSASLALRDMGFAARLAGTISDDPARPMQAVPLGVMGHLDSESILKLAPHFVIGSVGDVLPADPFLRRWQADGRFQFTQLSSPRTVAEALAQLEDVGVAVGQPQAGRRLRLHTQASLTRVLQMARTRLDAPRVLLLVSVTPEPSALGPNMLHGQLLTAMGCRNALPADAPDWLPLDREALIALNPDAVVLLTTETGTAKVARANADLQRLFANLPATANRRLRVVADALAMLPSSNLPALVEKLTQALAPNPHTP